MTAVVLPAADGLGLPAALAASDTDSRVRALALIAATRNVLTVHEQRLRGELEGEHPPGTSSDTGFGVVLATDPDARVTVTDADALAAWWAGEYPAECAVTDDVTVTDTAAVARAVAGLKWWVQAWTLDPDARPKPADLLALLDALTVTTRILLPEDAVKRLTVTSDGRVVDANGLLPDGVTATRSASQLRVTLDKAALASLEADLAARLSGAALEGGPA